MPDLIDPNERPSDNLNETSVILRFLEETAGNYGLRPANMEYGYSVDAWNGMCAILAHARHCLEAVRCQLVQKDL